LCQIIATARSAGPFMYCYPCLQQLAMWHWRGSVMCSVVRRWSFCLSVEHWRSACPGSDRWIDDSRRPAGVDLACLAGCTTSQVAIIHFTTKANCSRFFTPRTGNANTRTHCCKLKTYEQLRTSSVRVHITGKSYQTAWWSKVSTLFQESAGRRAESCNRSSFLTPRSTTTSNKQRH